MSDIAQDLRQAAAEVTAISIENGKLMDQIERLTAERDETMSKLANLSVAFNDWKVFHSTTRLEVELQLKAAENDELRRQLAEAAESIARQAATIRGLTRPAEAS